MNDNFIKEVVWDRTSGALPGDTYLTALPVVRFLEGGGRLPLETPITFLVGENGTGKSTLLEAVAVVSGFNAEGGSRNFNFSTEATHSGLWRYLLLRRGRTAKDGFFLRAESFYNVASYLDEMKDAAAFRSYGGKSLHEQSRGESFLALVQNRFGGNGLYFLDEPEAAVSPMRQMTLLAQMYELAGQGAQFIVATHSPILMSCPGGCVYQFREDGIEQVDYRETEHFEITRQFLNAPERMLEILTGEAQSGEQP